MNVEKRKLPQPMLPRGLAGRITAWFMVRGHKSIYKNVSKVLDLQPEDDLVEVACGSGQFLKKYASLVHSVAGLDLSELMVKLATKISSEIGRIEYVRLRIEDVQAFLIAAGGASILSSTTLADGFLLTEEDSEGYAEGEEVQVWLYDA